METKSPDFARYEDRIVCYIDILGFTKIIEETLREYDGFTLKIIQNSRITDLRDMLDGVKNI